ncbi:FG-GAP repeat domain-containing protein [Candidatus Foliamicus sp.]
MRFWRTIAVFALVLAASEIAFARSAQEDIGLFAVTETAIPPAAHQVVLPGSFDEHGRAQLAVVSVSAAGKRQVRLFALQGGEWRITRDAGLHPATLFVDVARLAEQDRLISYRPGSVDWFDPKVGKQRPLAALTTRYRAAAGDGIPHLDITRDVNGDGLDDLLAPDIDGFWLSLQSQNGSFGPAVKLGPPDPFADATAYGEARPYGETGITAENMPWYLSRVHRLDYDRDGRQDLLFWNHDHFLLYCQDARGEFVDSPRRLELGFALDFVGSYGLAFQFADANLASMLLGLNKRAEFTVLQDFRDLDGDRVADAVSLSLRGRSPFRLAGRYEVRFGRPQPDSISFPELADASFNAPGRSGGLQAWGYASQHFVDFDENGTVETMIGAVNIGLGGMLGAMLGNSISINLALFQLEGRGFPAKPAWTRTVRSPFAPLDKRGPLFPTVLVGDVNGDGRRDLLTGERWNELSVFLGVAGPARLARQAVKVAVAIPANERNARIADLDKDGKADVFIQHVSPTEPGRLLILMSR